MFEVLLETIGRKKPAPLVGERSRLSNHSVRRTGRRTAAAKLRDLSIENDWRVRGADYRSIYEIADVIRAVPSAARLLQTSTWILELCN